MKFNSLDFVLLFLPIVVIMHRALLARSGPEGAKFLLLAASIVFCALAGANTLPIMAASLLINHVVAGKVSPASTSDRRRWIMFGLFSNIAILGVFKYAHFTVENINGITGFHLAAPVLPLPLGLSFFTIQQVMYLVDCYEGMAAPASFLDHAVFFSFFPSITAGPIIRSSVIVPRLQERERVTDDGIATGLVLFTIGLAKKVLIADTLSILLRDVGAANAGSAQVLEAWTGAFGFFLQLYFDFSGYTDMALGAGRMLGFDLPPNFNTPFRATTVIDFWNRWHMTLTQFITTYLYTPMARAWRPFTFRRAMVVSVVSMSIAGFWHGPTWNFLIFGLMHGAGIATNHVWRRRKRKLPEAVANALTLIFVAITMVFFQTATLHDALAMTGGLFGLHGLGLAALKSGTTRFIAPLLLVGVLALRRLPNSSEIIAGFRPSVRWSYAIAGGIVVLLINLNGSGMKGFIYREF